MLSKQFVFCTCTKYMKSNNKAEWTEWYVWSKCSANCGLGVRERKRICQIGSDKVSCIGNSVEKSVCYNDLCHETTLTPPKSTSKNKYAIDGKWSKWSAWSTCDTCKLQSGNLKRTRICNTPSPSNGGRKCVGIDTDFKACYESAECSMSINLKYN